MHFDAVFCTCQGAWLAGIKQTKMSIDPSSQWIGPYLTNGPSSIRLTGTSGKSQQNIPLHSGFSGEQEAISETVKVGRGLSALAEAI